MAEVDDILAQLDTSRPIYVPKKKPSIFKTTLEEEKWFQWVDERCTYGDRNEYGLFIPPSLCFFAYEGTVVDRVNGNNEEKIIRDIDYILNINMYNSMLENKWDLYIKARNCGFTVQSAGNFPIFFAYKYPGINVNMTSADQKRITNMYRKCLLPMWQGMSDFIRPDQINLKNNDQDVGLTLSVNTIEDGKKKSKITSINLQPTAYSEKAASAFSGSGAKYSCIDELYLNPRAAKITESLIDVMTKKSTGKLEGYCCAGGTVENSVTAEQLMKYKQFWIEADNSHIWNKTFLPFYLGSFMNMGHSNRKLAQEDWDKKQEAFLKAGNLQGATAHKKNQPRNIDDIFEFAASSKWETDVAELIKVQHHKTLNEKKDEKNIWTPTVISNMNGVIEAEPTSKSDIVIMEQPKPNCKYFACVDGTGTGTETGNTDGSNFVTTIVKGYDPDGGSWGVVAVYNKRPNNLEEAFIKTLNLSLHYNRFGGLECISYEANTSVDYYSRFMSERGYLHMVAKRKDLSGKGYSKIEKYGQPRGTDMIDYQYKAANMFLRKYISNIKYIPLLEDMLKDFSANTDCLDSWLMLFVVLPLDFDKPIEKKKPKREMEWYQTADGTTGFRLKITDPNAPSMTPHGAYKTTFPQELIN